MNNRILAGLFVLCAILSALPRSSAQGPLTPPGPPGPTMKTLNQVEPRTPITNLPHTITSSGSYYVTTNLTCTACTSGQNGISFMFIPLAENVTIDLNGFTLVGVSGSGNGIDAFAGTNIVIRNGTVANWGADGANMSGTYNSRFENLQLNGNAHIGLEAGVGSIVVNCQAMGNTVGGISLLTGEISHCVAVGNGTGIVTSAGCVVADCTASGNSKDGINGGLGTIVRSCTTYQNGGHGITMSDDCAIIGCTVSTNNSSGISVGNNCTIKDCTVTGSNGDGIDVTNNCTVIGCTVSANNGDGIDVGNNCTVKDCTANANANGIRVVHDGNLIVGNTCNGNFSEGMVINGVQNRIDGNNFGRNTFYGLFAISVNVNNSITRNSAPGNGSGGYANYFTNADFAPISATVSNATNPWTNF